MNHEGASSKKLFGDFLVERGLLQPEQLLEALVIQMEEMPPTASVVYRNNLLSHHQLLQVLGVQVREGVDFREACRRKDLWTGELTKALESQLSQVRQPIGQILHQKGWIDFKQLTDALDDFLNESTVGLVPAVAVESKSSEVSDSSSSATAGAALSFPELKEINQAVADDYLMLMGDELRDQTIQLIQSLQEGDELAEQSQKVFNTVHMIKGSARFIQAFLSEYLMSHAEAIAKALVSQAETGALESAKFELAKKHLESLITITWKVKSHIEGSMNEEAALSNSTQKTEIEDLCREVSANWPVA